MVAGRAAGVAGLVAFLCGLALQCGSAGAAQLQQFPDGVNGAYALAAGPNGTVAILGFTDTGDVTVTTVDLDGTSRALPVDRRGYGGVTITFGPDGNYWVSGVASQPVITRISPTGDNQETFSVPGWVTSMTPGSDGNVWFLDATSHAGRITPSGEVTVFDAPGGRTISTGPDGNLWWFSQKPEGTPSTIVRMTPAGVVSEFPVPPAAAGSSGPDVNRPVIGAGGFLWTGTSSAGLLRTSLSGAVTLPKGDGYGDPFAGDADHLWAASDGIVQMNSTTGTVEHDFSVRRGLVGSSSGISEAVRATDGTFWSFSEGVANRVIPTLDPPTLSSWTMSASVRRIGDVVLSGKATIEAHGEVTRAIIKFGNTKKYTGEVNLAPTACATCRDDASGYDPIDFQVDHSPYSTGYCSAKGIIHLRMEVTNASGKVTTPDVVKPVQRCAPSFKCHVPKLVGKTLGRAQALLQAAGCRLGAVRGPRHHSKVVKQSPRPGVTRAANTRVKVTLAARH